MSLTKKIKVVAFLFLITGGNISGWAQTDSRENTTSVSTKKIMLLKTPWSESENAGSLSFFDFDKKIGSALVYTELQNKDFHLFREGHKSFGTGFLTNGFIKYGNWNFYGNFNYFNQTEKNTKWTGVMNPYDGNPYSIGDSIGGNYTKEYFKMHGKGALWLSNLVTFGFNIDYSAGVGAKRKDPRFENTITSFCISPGIIFTLNKIKLGANLKYQEEKEDIEISDVTGNIYYIFHFKGLGVSSSTPNYDTHVYTSDLLGGSIQLGFNNKRLQNLTEISFYKKSTAIKQGETFPLQLALLERYNTGIKSTFIFHEKSRTVNRLNLFFNNKHFYGNEPVVEPQLQSVSYQWSTITKYTLFWHKEIEYGIQYSFYKIIDKNRIDWGAQLSGNFNTNKTTYYFVPEFNEKKLNLLNLNVKLEKGFRMQKTDVVAEINGGLQKGYNGKLTIVEEESLLSTVNAKMLTHDFNYFDSKQIQIGTSATVGRDIIFNRKPIQLFAGAAFKNVISELQGKPKSASFEVKLGVNF